MPQKRIDGNEGEKQSQREPSGAPPLEFELAFALGCLAALFVLYGRPNLIGLIAAWLGA